MQFTFTLADKIDPVAVYAALVATMVFAWNVYVWRNSGPRLNVTATMNMLVIGGGADEEKKSFLNSSRDKRWFKEDDNHERCHPLV